MDEKRLVNLGNHRLGDPHADDCATGCRPARRRIAGTATDANVNGVERDADRRADAAVSWDRLFAVDRGEVMQEETTGNVRGWGGVMAVAGAILCATPLLPMGAVLAIVGAVMWLAAPANAKRTQQMATEAEEGGGCMAGLAAALFAVIVMVLAGVLAIAAVGGLAA